MQGTRASGMATAAFALVLLPGPLLAHHGTSRYDLERTITLSGTVTGFDWGNPHCLVHMDVKGSGGEIQHWTLELASPFTMSHAGWSKDSLRLGDEVVVDTHPARNGVPLGISATSRSVMKFIVNGKPLSTQDELPQKENFAASCMRRGSTALTT